MPRPPYTVFETMRYREGVNLTAKEMQRVFLVLDRNDFLFHPHDSRFGFFPCYSVKKIEAISPGISPETTTLLAFSDNQLPRGYDFQKLSEQFMKEENLGRAEFAEIKVINNRSRFDY